MFFFDTIWYDVIYIYPLKIYTYILFDEIVC